MRKFRPLLALVSLLLLTTPGIASGTPAPGSAPGPGSPGRVQAAPAPGRVQAAHHVATALAKPDADINHIPYISTYYIQPRVELGKQATIDYYVTDWHHRDYMHGDRSLTFTIDYWVNGKRMTLRGVHAGDNSMTLPLLPEGQVMFAFQATDQQGRTSHRLYQAFRVVDPKDETIPRDKILTPDLAKFGIHNDDTHPVETTSGLTAMLKWASDNGYRKVVLPKGTYRIDENSTVEMATHLTLDMNGSTSKLNPNALGKGLMFEMVHCDDSHVINGTFEGDLKKHDFKKAPHNSEWLVAVSMGQDTTYCSYKDITIIDVTGYGSSTGIGGAGTRQYSYNQPKGVGQFVLGDIDAKGRPVKSTVRTTSVKPIDISGFVQSFGFIQLGVYLGYQGNPALNWVYKASFYDKDQHFIGQIPGYMYRRLYPPANAYYARFTLYSTATPKNLSLFNFRAPYNCAFVNVHHKNVRCVGMVPSGFNNLLVEGCTFENCGWASAHCAFDAEDGWDLMQDLTFRHNVFGKNPANEFLTCAGHNFVMTNNTMKVYIWDRTRNYVFRNNTIKSAEFRFGSHYRTGYPRIYGNTIQGGTRLNLTSKKPGRDYCIRDNICNGDVRGTASGKTNDGHSVYFYKCKITGGGVNARAVDCDIKDMQNKGGWFEIIDSRIDASLIKQSGTGVVDKVIGCTIAHSRVKTQGGTIILKNNKISDTQCYAGGGWSHTNEYILSGNTIDTDHDYLIAVGNSYKRMVLNGNIIRSTNPKFAAVRLINPTQANLTDQAVTLVGNTFDAKGGVVLDIQRLPHAKCMLTVHLFQNTYHGIAPISKNAKGVANVKIVQASPIR